ncbi:uncharacterized protein LOC129359904 isoform X2 [Poeciliopsis prolifica]|uniref:uncharacterized protein LOC129359904 isoform X2 n=1 Tax=Poeciliopsis prolifica TaxID=188132 RepID=UPI002413BC36|nr:uncharacterized protein LOC129359904 isoform X2 [Poeciliopsis prolifica]
MSRWRWRRSGCRRTRGPQRAADPGRSTEVLPLTYRIMAVHQAVSGRVGPDLRNLEDPRRLRVLSSRALSIVRNRDVQNFETVMAFLDATHRLLPGLVPAIKHMKIQFGLKTMVVMQMLREGRGAVHIVSSIIRFFPNKLPEYEDQCSQREMFLMRKNQADFRRLVQNLAFTKERLQDYMKGDMEERYGERYAQKVEQRLLAYLQEVWRALPADTYSCRTGWDRPEPGLITLTQMMKKQHPEDEEETSAPSSAGRKLLGDARPSETSLQRRPEADWIPQVSSGSSPDVGEPHGPEDGTEPEIVEEEDVPPSPRFCSTHQRWMDNFLRGCAEDDLPLLSDPTPVPSDPTPVPSDPTPVPSDTTLLPSSSEDQMPSDRVSPLSRTSEGSDGPVLLVPVVQLEDVLWRLGSNPSQPVSAILVKAASCGSSPGSLARQTSMDQNVLEPAGSAPVLTDPAQQGVHQNSIRSHPETQTSRTVRSRSQPGSPVGSRTSALLGCLQPCVVLTRLSAKQCCSFTDPEVRPRPARRPSRDPDYRPHVNRKRFLSEVQRVRRVRFPLRTARRVQTEPGWFWF